MAGQLQCVGEGWKSLDWPWALGRIIIPPCHLTTVILHLGGRQPAIFIKVNHCNSCSTSSKNKKVAIHMYRFYDSQRMAKMSTSVCKNLSKKHGIPAEGENK